MTQFRDIHPRAPSVHRESDTQPYARTGGVVDLRRSGSVSEKSHEASRASERFFDFSSLGEEPVRNDAPEQDFDPYVVPREHARFRDTRNTLDPSPILLDFLPPSREPPVVQPTEMPISHFDLPSEALPARRRLAVGGAKEGHAPLRASFARGAPATGAEHSRRVAKSFFVAMLLSALLIPSFAAWRSINTVKQSLLVSVSEAAGKIHAATSAMAAFDTALAQGSFLEAARSFRDAQERLASVGFGLLSLIAELPLSNQLTSGKSLLVAGEDLASAGEQLASAMMLLETLSPDPLMGLVASGSLSEQSAKNTPGPGFVFPWEDFSQKLEHAASRLSHAAEILERVEPSSLPETYRPTAQQAIAAIPAIQRVVTTIEESSSALAGILGMNEPRRYVVLLQNSSELRPTGGFIGNLGLVTIGHGTVRDFRVEDVYLLDGQLMRYTVPPKPIQDISQAWSLHDANWFLDFPTSAKTVSGFYEQTGNATPDGVIAVSSKLFEDILSVTGPLVTEDGLTVQAGTLTDTLNALGAAQKPGETTQVRAVQALLPALVAQLSRADSSMRLQLSEIFKRRAASRDIQMWFKDEDEERFISRLGVGGALPDTQGDFLAIVHANINGLKTDRVIEEEVAHEATIASDGSVVDTVAITRRHRGNERNEPWYRGVNKTYTRVMVPLGSTLLLVQGVTCDVDARGVDYAALGYRVHPIVASVEATERLVDGTCVTQSEESGKTVFGAWLFVSPGEEATARFTYRLPRKLDEPVDSYRLLVVKQPGWEPRFSLTVRPDIAWETAWRDEELAPRGDASPASDSLLLVRDRFFGAVFKKVNE